MKVGQVQRKNQIGTIVLEEAQTWSDQTKTLTLLNIFKKLNKTRSKEVKKTRKMMVEQSGNISEVVEITKKNQTEIFELQSTRTKRKLHKEGSTADLIRQKNQ